MKKTVKLILVISIFMCASTVFVKSQNLVLNPGFDSYITCPGFGQFSNVYINDWNKPTIGSSDYFHYNCACIQPSVQVPRSGEGYSGIYSYNYGTEYREYITGTLSSPLVTGQTYEVEFYVSLNDGYIQAIVEMGAYLSSIPPGPFSNALHINVIPQIENNSGPLQDTSIWKKVSGQIVAQGGEQYITIGNFHNDTTTTISQPGTIGSYGAYYFIDDVSVIVDSTTALSENPQEANFNFYWEPGNNLVVVLSNNSVTDIPVKISVFDINGKTQHTKIEYSAKAVINFEQKQTGLYFLSVEEINGKTTVKKLPFIRN